MTSLILLDTGPLGLVTNPRVSAETRECTRWLEHMLINGRQVCISEIADYEVRRELLRAGKTQGVRRLDAFKATICYMPLTTTIMLRAAEFWALARKQGKPTADDKALDGDVILAAQARASRGAACAIELPTVLPGSDMCLPRNDRTRKAGACCAPTGAPSAAPSRPAHR